MSMLAPASRAARLVTARIGQPPLPDAHAPGSCIAPGSEARGDNAADNQRVPTAAQLAGFHAQNQQPHSWAVDRFRGTTDEIIQWAAAKRRSGA